MVQVIGRQQGRYVDVGTLDHFLHGQVLAICNAGFSCFVRRLAHCIPLGGSDFDRHGLHMVVLLL